MARHFHVVRDGRRRHREVEADLARSFELVAAALAGVVGSLSDARLPALAPGRPVRRVRQRPNLDLA
jgi:hypothetical protein